MNSMGKFQHLRDYLWGTQTHQVQSPTKVIRGFLFDVDSSGYKSKIKDQVELIADDGHPLGLGNPVILRNLLSHLSTSDVLQVRQVNLRWNHIACEYLRRNLGHCKLRPSNIKSFLRMMKKCFCNPFGSYAMRIDYLTDKSIRNFFDRFSFDIIRLRVRISSKEIPEFSKLLHKMASLEELHLIRIPEEIRSLRLEYFPDQAWRHGIYQFKRLTSIILETEDPATPFVQNYDACIVNIINSSPNLVIVKFSGWDSHLARLMTRCGLSNPKSFDGWKNSTTTMSEDLIELFYRREMKFKALRFTIDKTLTFDLVMDLTLKTCETLYNLSFDNNDPSERFTVSIKFPLLINLGLKTWRGPVDFSEMHNHFPNLRSLKINRAHLHEIENMSEEEIREFLSVPLLTTLETLIIAPSISIENCAIDKDLMIKVVHLFPTVQKLFVQVEGNETLHVIYESLPNLKLLCIDLRENISDEAFTGIPDELVSITEMSDCLCPRVTFTDDSRRLTHIGCLTSLSVLIVRSRPTITNLSLIQGISMLKNLETLWLLPSIENEPSKWCIRAIADSLKSLKQLVTSSCISYSEEDQEYLKYQLPRLEHRGIPS